MSERADHAPAFEGSLGRAAAAAAGSVPVVAVAALSLFATWTAYIAIGARITPRFLAVAMAAPPAHAFFDAVAIFTPPGDPLRWAVAIVALAALRSLSFGVLGLFLVRRLRPGDERTGRPLRRGSGIVGRLFVVYLVHFAVGVLAFQAASRLFGPLTVPLFGLGVYFLTFVAPAIVGADLGVLAALREGVASARRAGPAHLAVVVGYVAGLLYVASVAPFGTIAPTTPTPAIWAYGLLMTMLHVVVFALLVERFLAARSGGAG